MTHYTLKEDGAIYHLVVNEDIQSETTTFILNDKYIKAANEFIQHGSEEWASVIAHGLDPDNKIKSLVPKVKEAISKQQAQISPQPCNENCKECNEFHKQYYQPKRSDFAQQAEFLSYELPGANEMVKHPVTNDIRPLRSVIMNLNDSHGWSRDQIADWVEALDLDLRFGVKLSKETEYQTVGYIKDPIDYNALTFKYDSWKSYPALEPLSKNILKNIGGIV